MSEIEHFDVLVFGSGAGGILTAWVSAKEIIKGQRPRVATDDRTQSGVTRRGEASGRR
jgi:hypothetical protein